MTKTATTPDLDSADSDAICSTTAIVAPILLGAQFPHRQLNIAELCVLSGIGRTAMSQISKMLRTHPSRSANAPSSVWTRPRQPARALLIPASKRLRNMLRHAAASLARHESVLGEHYRRMRGRMGPIGANTIVAHKLARILWHLVTHQQEYDESVLAKLDAGREARRLARLQRQAQALNLRLVPFPTTSANTPPTAKEAA
jgi:hypothetical protein